MTWGDPRLQSTDYALEMDEQIIGLSIRLGEVAAKNTAGAIAEKVRLVRGRKETQESVSQLVEIIDDLIADKIELLQIAHGLEEDLVAQRMSPEQAATLVGAVVPTLRLLMAQTGNSDPSFESFIALLTPEMIVALQLLGFNFRKAVGEPLTDLLASFLASKASNARSATSKPPQPPRR